MDSQLLGSLLEAIGVVTAAIITGACLFISARRISSRDKLTKELRIALNDILVFTAIEAELLQRSGMAKPALRELMRQKNLELSGKYTPSLARRKLQQLD